MNANAAGGAAPSLELQYLAYIQDTMRAIPAKDAADLQSAINALCQQARIRNSIAKYHAAVGVAEKNVYIMPSTFLEYRGRDPENMKTLNERIAHMETEITKLQTVYHQVKRQRVENDQNNNTTVTTGLTRPTTTMSQVNE